MPPGTSTVIRAEFTVLEAQVIDGARGEISRALFVRDLLRETLRTGRMPPHPARPYDQARAPKSVRLAFRLNLGDVAKLDTQRKFSSRAAWIREVVMRYLPPPPARPEPSPASA